MDYGTKDNKDRTDFNGLLKYSLERLAVALYHRPLIKAD